MAGYSLTEAYVKLAKIRLTHKQKVIVRSVHTSNDMTVTKFVSQLAGAMSCSKTAIWNNLRQLKECEIIDCGSANAKGRRIRLTEPGLFLAEGLK